jgi:hypothetical protein
MRKILFIVAILVIGYKGWGYMQSRSVKPMHDTPYLTVYGRNGCGNTMNTLKHLSEAKIKFEYEQVDDPSVAKILHERMNLKGISTQYYILPVVDLNSEIIVNPNNEELVRRAKRLSL